jgi:hypothetical protein
MKIRIRIGEVYQKIVVLHGTLSRTILVNLGIGIMSCNPNLTWEFIQYNQGKFCDWDWYYISINKQIVLHEIFQVLIMILYLCHHHILIWRSILV